MQAQATGEEKVLKQIILLIFVVILKQNKTKNKTKRGNNPLKGIGEVVNSMKFSNDQPCGNVPQEYRGVKINKQPLVPLCLWRKINIQIKY